MPFPQFHETPLIDSDQFDMLVETGEDEAAEMLQELLDLFISETTQKLADLDQAAATEDRHRCNRIAHAVAGASANLGGLRLSSFARAYEAAAPETPKEDLLEGAVTMRAICKETIDAIGVAIQRL